MLVDFERDPSLPSEPDICIVGAGIAGLVLATELARHGLVVLVLEGGGERDEARSQALFQVQTAARPHAGAVYGRARVLGGSSTRWGGQLLPLEPLDFVERQEIVGSGWPITGMELGHYVERAPAYLRMGPVASDATSARRRQRALPAWQPDRLQPRWSVWAPWRFRNVARNLRDDLQRQGGLVVATHANVVEIVGQGDRVDGLRVRSYGGREQRVRARAYVIACGTIETARLLLASRAALPVLQHLPAIGRYFIDHLSIRAGRIHEADRPAFMQAFQPFFEGPTLRTPKLQLAPALQTAEASLAAQGHVVFDLDPNSALGMARTALQSRQKGSAPLFSPSMLAALGKSLPDAVGGLGARLFLGLRPVPSQSAAHLQIDVEQQPRPESRIGIGSEVDALGMPRAIVDWRWDDLERRSARLCASTIAAEFERLGMGRIDWAPGFVDGDDDAFDAAVRDIYHMAGTARMGTDIETSVVDPKLQVHGIDNLYVAGCVVMPTIGCGNPTLTMMALTLRLAEHLRDRLADSPLAA